jgi:hypothetical protein
MGGESCDEADSLLLAWYKVHKKKFKARESHVEVY